MVEWTLLTMGRNLEEELIFIEKGRTIKVKEQVECVRHSEEPCKSGRP